jgi:hypothetical protein
MGKLHEVVAVEKDVKGTATKIIDETSTTFSKKHQLFGTHSKLYEPLIEGDLERPEEENAQPITTIGDKLSYFEQHIVRLFDIIIQKEEANSRAKEDVIIHEESGDIVLARAVPVSALVQLENHFEILRSKVYDTIPTLDPTKDWIDDNNAGKGKFMTGVVTRQRCIKKPKAFTLFAGSEKHPPQVQMINEDEPVGNWKIKYFSGMISPASKSEILKRVDIIIEAIKKARSRANDTEVTNLEIGKRLFKFINEGK